MKKIDVGNLKISSELFDFINNEAIPETGIDKNTFWSEFEKAVEYLAPKNKSLLAKREEIQKKIDEWHISRKELIKQLMMPILF